MTELLDLAELLLDRSSTPSAELRAGSAEDDERTLLLDFALTLEEDFALDEEFDFTELLLASSQSSQTDEEESSASGLTKLSLSLSPHAAKNANIAPTANNFENFMFLLQIIWHKYNQNTLEQM